MAKDTVTIALDGEVTLQRFSSAISNLVALINALSKEIISGGSIKWIVQSLEVSSAVATARGESDVLEQVEAIVDAYGDIGASLESGQRPNYSEKVTKITDDIVNLLEDGISAIRFETPDRDTVRTKHMPSITSAYLVKSHGAIEGRIQTLTNRKGLRFTLYDTLHDKAVSCYLKEGQEDLIRAVWGKRAIIQGEISRESASGRPVAIRNIDLVKTTLEVQAGAYLKARGIMPIQKDTSILPEIIIRQARDAA